MFLIFLNLFGFAVSQVVEISAYSDYRNVQVCQGDVCLKPVSWVPPSLHRIYGESFCDFVHGGVRYNGELICQPKPFLMTRMESTHQAYLSGFTSLVVGDGIQIHSKWLSVTVIGTNIYYTEANVITPTINKTSLILVPTVSTFTVTTLVPKTTLISFNSTIVFSRTELVTQIVNSTEVVTSLYNKTNLLNQTVSFTTTYTSTTTSTKTSLINHTSTEVITSTKFESVTLILNSTEIIEEIVNVTSVFTNVVTKSETTIISLTTTTTLMINSTSPPVVDKHDCSQKHIICNGECLGLIFVCDGYLDCKDGSDEYHC